MYLNVICPQVTKLVDSTEWNIDKPGLKKKSVKHKSITYELIQYFCQVCENQNPRVFMVKEHIWKKSKLDGFICIHCFQEKIGRRLREWDLTIAPCNDYFIVRGIVE